MADRILLHGLEFYGYHGVQLAERSLGQRFRVDAELTVDLAPAAARDDVSATVDYAAAATRLLAIGTGSPVHLLETLALRMAEDLLAWDARIEAVTVRVTKLHPPVPGLREAAVEVTRRRGGD